MAAIRKDYDTNYFVSGKGSCSPVALLLALKPDCSHHPSCLRTCCECSTGEMSAYEKDCLFADPFAGFNGVDRFKKNVSNLGALM